MKFTIEAGTAMVLALAVSLTHDTGMAGTSFLMTGRASTRPLR